MPKYEATITILEESYITLELVAKNKQSAKLVIEQAKDIFHHQRIRILTNDPSGYELEHFIKIKQA